jgi:hypothetical protein
MGREMLHIEKSNGRRLRRGTAREMLGYYKEAIDGLSLSQHAHCTYLSRPDPVEILLCIN